jgi:hypothetical protein
VFVTPEDVKTYCNVGANVNSVNMLPIIKLAQDLYIKKVMGKTLYDKFLVEWDLANRVADNLRDATQTSDIIDYKELYKQFFLPLVWWSYTHFIYSNGIKVEEKGVMLNNSAYAENGGLELVRAVEDRTRAIAQNYQDEFVCYVKDTFKDEINIKDETSSNGTSNPGIFFPSANRNKLCKKC